MNVDGRVLKKRRDIGLKGRESSKVIQVIAMAVIGVVAGLACFTVAVADNWIYGYSAIISLYILFAVLMFSIITPSVWEGSIVFLFFTVIAVFFIFLFSGLYYKHELSTAGLDQFSLLDGYTSLESLYFSTAVFTTLGFGDIIPSGTAGKVAVATEAVMGMTYGATAIITFLGHKGWVAARGGESVPSTIECHAIDLTGLALRDIQSDQNKALEDISSTLSELRTQLQSAHAVNRLAIAFAGLGGALLVALGCWIGRLTA
ncbi:MAG: ion channel [Pseudomonas caspiana]